MTERAPFHCLCLAALLLSQSVSRGEPAQSPSVAGDLPPDSAALAVQMELGT